MSQESTSKHDSSPQRENVSVLFTDIVGYTKLMELNESDALSKLNFFKEKLEKRISNTSGQLIQYYGDAALVTFKSPEEATETALLLQRDMQGQLNVPLRIGLHMGEVVIKNNNVFGDTVNVASRLETMGVAGSILCSEKFKNVVEGNEHFKFKDLGKFTLKNVQDPVQVFALSNGGLIIPTKKEIDKKIAVPNTFINQPIFKWSMAGILALIVLAGGFFLKNENANPNPIEKYSSIPDDKSIAVLPFANLSSDQDNQYFSDGVMEDILNRLTSVKDLRVMSRTSVLRYRNTEKPLAQVASELGVSHILEGSIRRVDDKIRIIVNLIQAKTEMRIWSESYDRVVNDIFGIQSEIAERIGKGLEVSFLPKETILVDYQPTKNADAYDQFLKGRNRMHIYQENRREEDLELAFDYFDNALSIDSELAVALAYIGYIHILRHTYFGAPSSAVDSSFTFLQKSLAIHPELPEGYLFRSKYYELKKQLVKMEADLKQALSLAPNSVDVLRNLGSYYVTETDDMEKSIPYYKKAVTLEPFNVRPLISLSNMHKLVSNLDKSKAYLDKAVKMEPKRVGNFMRLADLSMVLGDFTMAQKAAKRILEINPDFIWGNHILAETYAFNGEYLAAEKYYRVIQKIVAQEDFVESFGTPPFRHRLGFVLWKTDRKKEANILFKEMIKKNLKIVNSDIDNLGGARYDLAATHAFLGQNDESIKWMERIFKDGSWFDYHYTQIDPMFEPVRKDERFQAIMNREKEKIIKMQEKVNRMESIDFL